MGSLGEPWLVDVPHAHASGVRSISIFMGNIPPNNKHIAIVIFIIDFFMDTLLMFSNNISNKLRIFNINFNEF